MRPAPARPASLLIVQDLPQQPPRIDHPEKWHLILIDEPHGSTYTGQSLQLPAQSCESNKRYSFGDRPAAMCRRSYRNTMLYPRRPSHHVEHGLYHSRDSSVGNHHETFNERRRTKKCEKVIVEHFRKARCGCHRLGERRGILDRLDTGRSVGTIAEDKRCEHPLQEPRGRSEGLPLVREPTLVRGAQRQLHAGMSACCETHSLVRQLLIVDHPRPAWLLIVDIRYRRR